ncbi:Na+/H+ antiporter NhaC family protein [Chloroflexota bacterium]
MTASTTEKPKETGRTPSMLASLLVLGVMVALILLSVGFFGGEVAEGPLQVSMTLATLFALAVAYYYGFRGSLISHAISSSLSGVMGTIFVILAIGTVIGTLYLTGTVANIIYYGVAIISAKFYYVTIFILALALSMMLGSSLTTVGAVGVAFVGLASIMGVNPATAAGAAVAGAIMGNKTAKISDTVNLTVAAVGGVTVAEQTRVVMRTAIPTILISALIFLVLGLTGGGSAAGVDPAQVQSAITEYFNISLWAFIPVLLIFALSALRFSAYMALMIPAIVAVVLAGFTQHDLIVSLAADPSLSYFQAFLKVGIDTLAHGFHLNSGIEQLDKLFAGGGATGMLTTIWLLLVAASFGAVADYTGMLQRVVTPVINWAKGPVKLILVTMLTSMGLNIVTADPFVSIVLSARMFRQQYIKERLKPVVLSATLADSGSIFSNIVPWNVHGAIFAATLGLGTAIWAPFTFTAYLTPLVTFVIANVVFRKQRLPEAEDAAEVYGEEPSELPEPADLA